jgi:hypothetical protein
VGLIVKYAKAGAPEVERPRDKPEPGDHPLGFAY